MGSASALLRASLAEPVLATSLLVAVPRFRPDPFVPTSLSKSIRSTISRPRLLANWNSSCIGASDYPQMPCINESECKMYTKLSGALTNLSGTARAAGRVGVSPSRPAGSELRLANSRSRRTRKALSFSTSALKLYSYRVQYRGGKEIK